MSYQDELKFGWEFGTYGTYGNAVHVESISYKKMVDTMLQNAAHDLNLNGLITTRIPHKLMGFTLKDWHLLSLDCDSATRLSQAHAFLNEQKIAHTVFRSSPDHFWILCNVIGRFKKVKKFMDRIPGVDQEYVGFTEDRGMFVLRAFPKAQMEIPVRINTYPFPDLSSITRKNSLYRHRKLYLRFVEDFEAYWASILVTTIRDRLDFNIIEKEQAKAAYDMIKEQVLLKQDFLNLNPAFHPVLEGSFEEPIIPKEYNSILDSLEV